MKLNEGIEQLPQYRCHKVVRAGRIHTCIAGVLGVQVGNSKAIIEITVGQAWVQKHKPQADGYLVAYEDGYLSYSPADVFEAGYHELPELGNSCGGVGAYGLAPATQDDINRRAVKALNTIMDTAPAALTTDLPPHQLRVLQELVEVSKRHHKLMEFTTTDTFASLDEQERDRLARQSLAMSDYVRILTERVAAF